MDLSIEEKIRYSRHLNLPQFGVAAQQKLKESSVLVVGTGGLGAPLLQYLTAAGVGKIGIMDFDDIDTSNLQRQILFGTSDVGKRKTEVAHKRLKDLNPYVEFKIFDEPLNSENALEIIKDYDVVADGTDNFPTRYLVNDACVLNGKVNVYASIFQYEGQVSVFNLEKNGQRGPNYRDLYPTPPPPGLVPSCAEGGVLGVLPGIVGSIQAMEVIKVLTGLGTPLSGKLFLFDALDFTTRKLNVRKDDDNPLTGNNPTITQLIDYDEFCGINPVSKSVKSISIEELKRMQSEKIDFVLIDVREPHEYELGNIGGKLIPLSNIIKENALIPKDGTVIVYCKSGARSAKAIEQLDQKLGYTNLLNLDGGILAWKNAFAPELKVV